ncbi:MAG: ribosomal protein S18-alanine N-acetyltransferase [Rhodocyclaceae bacterium]|nr:ribosomal protein S18-alanine N-acetyltransferase [Rhodocyclaceae bacterium]
MSAVPEIRPVPLAFRPMGEADVDAVLAAEQRMYPFPWTRGNFVDSVRSAYRAWVCEAAGELVGYAVVTVTLDEAQLLNISVVPERRRQRLGVALMEHLMADARRQGAKQLFLEVRPSNAAGLALYAHFGFHRIGRRRDYYPAETGREDAIVMARVI